MQHLLVGENASADDERKRAWQKILRMASIRELSSAKARERLSRDGYSDTIIEETMARALDLRIIDDLRYADALVRMRLATGKGIAPVLREIESLGVDLELVDSYQEHLSLGEEADLERAIMLLKSKPPRSKNRREGAYRRLVQAGFNASTASRAARLWSEEPESYE